MNQPKFKFGDKATFSHKDTSTEITVLLVQYVAINSDGSGEYKYNGGFWESELTEFREPQKKKLYAYSFNYEVKFHIGDMPQLTTREYWGDEFIKVTTYLRAPEYDIDYPLNHSSKE